MDLTRLSRDDLHRLQSQLRTIATAAEALAEGDLEPEICLGADETVIRTAPLVGAGPAPELVMPLDAQPVEIEPAPRAEADPVAKERRRAALPARADLVSGPLTPAEREQILSGIAAGLSPREIGRNLNRRPQTVALWVAARKNDGGSKSAAPFVHVAEAAKDVVCASIVAAQTKETGQPTPATTEAGDTGPQKAGKPATTAPEAGGAVTRSRTPGAKGGSGAPGKAAGASGSAPAATIPDTPFMRRISGYLDGLKRSRDWPAAQDLEMVERFRDGIKLPMLALEMGIDPLKLDQRYKLITQPIRDDRGRMIADRQDDLITVLRNRAGADASA